MSEWIAANWEYVLVGIYALEKIVKMTPTKYDDIVFDMILKPIKEKFAPSKKQILKKYRLYLLYMVLFNYIKIMENCYG